MPRRSVERNLLKPECYAARAPPQLNFYSERELESGIGPWLAAPYAMQQIVSAAVTHVSFVFAEYLYHTAPPPPRTRCASQQVSVETPSRPRPFSCCSRKCASVLCVLISRLCLCVFVFVSACLCVSVCVCAYFYTGRRQTIA